MLALPDLIQRSVDPIAVAANLAITGGAPCFGWLIWRRRSDLGRWA
jgi:hypothetical protein